MHESNTPTKSFSFGNCAFVRTSPPIDTLSPATKMLNVAINFEEALKLNLAFDECVRRLNSYKRNTKAGKRAGLNLSINLKDGRISVNEEAI